ncbi:MAG: tandem-95 repeat protein [Planctomycetota bacterium]
MAVTNAAVVPSDLNQLFNPNPSNPNARLTPVNSTRRLIDDNFDDSFLFTIPPDTPSELALINELGYAAERPIVEAGFDSESAIPYSLDDIRLFVSLDSGISGTNQSSLVSVNPFTGVVERLIGQNNQPLGDIAARPDGELFGYTTGAPVGTPPDDGNIGNYWNLSPIDASITNGTGDDDNITFSQSNQNFDGVEDDAPAQLIINAVTFPLENNLAYTPTGGFAESTVRRAPVSANGISVVIGNRDNQGRFTTFPDGTIGPEVPDDLANNILYIGRQGDGELSSLGSFNDNADRQFGFGNFQIPYVPSLHGAGSDEIEFGIVDTGNIYNTGGDGGIIQGVAFDPDGATDLFAVTDQGGIHSFDFTETVSGPFGSVYEGYDRIIPTIFHGVLPKDPAHEAVSFFPNQPPSFSGLAMGPRVASNEVYRQTLFATTSDGWLYAMELDPSGAVQPANVFYNGRAAVQLTFVDTLGPDSQPLFAAPTGLAFSNLEASPWHLTPDRFADDGHGLRTTVDESRIDTLAGNSLYFGFETLGQTFPNDTNGNALARADDSNLGELSPGGVHGSVVTRSIDLEGYSAADKPTLYFSYFIEVEDPDDFSPAQLQRDSFRVFGAGDDGEWQLLATNNNFRVDGLDDEFDYFQTTGIPVQELFDDGGTWRQARVDLSSFAGNENVRVRFDVSTAGSMRTHFDSIELVAVAGDEVTDGELVTFIDEFNNPVRLESVVGVEVLFGNGSELNVGDVITLSGPTVTSSVTFVAGPAGPGEVQVLSTMSAEDVAEAVIDALDPSVSGLNLGNGLVQFRAASALNVIGNSRVGETSPLLFQRNDPTISTTLFTLLSPGVGEAAEFRVPNGLAILPGDTITITNGVLAETYTFVDTLTGAPNEVPYLRTETADTIGQRLFDLIPLDFQAIYEGDGVITVLAIGAQATSIAPDVSPLISSDGDTDEARIEANFPAFTAVTAGEIYTVRHAEGVDRFQLVFTPNAPALPGVTNVVVDIFANDDDIAEAVRRALPQITGGFVTVADNLSVAVSSFTVAGSVDALSFGPATGRRLTLPSGSNLVDGEQLSIIDDDGQFDFTFVLSALPSPPGQINFLPGDSAADIAQRVFNNLPGGQDRFLMGDTIEFYGAPITYALEPTSNISSTQFLLQEIEVPDAAQLADQETLDITVGGVIQQVVFVDAIAPGAANEVNFQAGDTANVIAARLVNVLSNLGIDADTTLGPTTLRFEASLVEYSGYNPSVQLGTDSVGRDVLLLPLTDVTQIRSGLVIELETFPGGFGPTIGFVQRGDTIRPNADIIVFFDRTAFDLAAELDSVIQQMIRGLETTFFNIEIYIDPLGRGVIVNSPTAQTVAVGDVPTEIDLNTVAINDSVVPLTLPTVNEVRSGVDTLTITTKTDGPGAPSVFNLVFVDLADSTGAPNEIVYDSTAITTAAELADVVVRQLPPEVQAFRFGTRQIHFLNAQIVETAAGSWMISGGVATVGNSPLIVDSTLSSRAVAERLQISLNHGAGQFVTSSADDTPRDTFTRFAGDRLRLYNLTPTDPGPFGISGYDLIENTGALSLTTTPVPGDEFGFGRSGFFATSQISTVGASGNEVEGVYIDDVVVGFAERGELVVDGSTDTTFSLDPAFLPDTHPLAVQPERQNETLVGPYALEIRTSETFGVAQDFDPTHLVLDEQFGVGRSFDVNDRLVDGAVSLLPTGGTQLVDGDTFVLYDGWQQLTFEFDSSLDPGVTPGNVPVAFDPSIADSALVAGSIRDAINSPQVQNVLNITAATSDGFETAANTGSRVELFGSSSIVVNPSGGRFIKADLVDAETSQGRETSLQIPIVDQVAETIGAALFGDELARSTPTGFTSAETDTFVGIGKIGDAVQTGQVGLEDSSVVLPLSPGSDFGSVRIYLNAGDAVDIDVDTAGFSRAGEVLDLPVISVFESGEQLTEDLFRFDVDPARQTSLFTPSSAPGESDPGAFLQFTAPDDGFYDVVVSSANIFGTQELNFATAFPNPAPFFEGETLTIQVGFSQVVYQFTTNAATVSPNVLIVLDPADTPEQIAEKTAEAIRANQSEFLKVDADGANVNLLDLGDTFASITPSFFLFQTGLLSSTFRALDFGEYSLTIRPTAASGNVPARDVLMVDYHFGIGDTNRVQDQGQIVISSNFITDSQGTGVRAVSDQRGQTLVNTSGPGGAITPNPDSVPQPGSAGLLRNQNTDALIPGVVIENNVIAGSGDAAIEFGGDINANGNIPSPASFGRIVNNTVVNSGSGDGVRISGVTSPTVLNNIFSGFNNGILTTGNQAGEIVVGGNAFQDNNNNSDVGLASSSFVIPTGVPLFQDPAREIYIPAPLSDVIDSSFASLPDRQEFFQTVKEPVGIAASPIIAPEFDAYGQARVDDPLVTTPGGVGSNVFIDRGAIDRADDVRPTAILVGPQDAINVQVVGGDQDPDASFVRLTEGTVTFFEVQLLDPAGTGIDADSVTVESVILTENGVRLVPGRDYVFGYSSNSNSIRLTPLTGIWRPDAVYEITLNNKQRLEVGLPSGDAITDGDQIVVDDSAGGSTTFEFESGYSLVIPQTSTLTVTGTNAAFTDGELINITSPSLVVRELEFDTDGSTTQPGAIAVDISAAGTIQDVRDAILAALQSVDPIDPTMTVAEAVSLTPVAVGLDQIQLGTVAGHLVNEGSAALTLTGVAGGVAAGDTLVYQTATDTVTFEFTQTFVTDPAFAPILFTPTDTPDQIAAAVATAVAGQPIGLGTAAAVGGGRVVLGGEVGDIATVNSASVVLEGMPGVSAGAIPLSFIPSASFTSSIAAATLQSAIRNSGIPVTTFNPGGGSLFLDGATAVSATFGGVGVGIASRVPAITDLAGNRVRETRITDETRFTIVMPEVVFDFGDAPNSFGTRLDANGARHTISDLGLPRLGAQLDDEIDGQPVPASDDAPLFFQPTSPDGLFEVLNPAPNEFTVSPSGAIPAGGERFVLTIASQTVTFELVRATDNPTTGNTPIVFASNESLESIIQKLFLSIRAEFDQIGASILMDLNGDTITLRAIDDEDGVPVGTFVSNSVSYQVFTQPGTNPNNVVGDDVIGFINPLDPAGSTVPVTVTGGGLVDIWIDYDQNGVFNAAEEHAVQSVPVVDGLNLLNVPPVPAAEGETWMRVRLSPSGNLSPTGVAVGGEVEDYFVSVIPIDLPTPIDDTYDAVEDTLLVIDSISTQPDLLANDLDIDIQLLPVRYFIGQDVQNGTLTVTDRRTGEFTYQPDPDFYGTDTFTYRLSTQENAGASVNSTFATVTITVAPVNDIPGAEDKSLTGLEDTTLVIDQSVFLAGSTGHGNPAIPTPPLDESIQELRLVAITASGETINIANQSGTLTTAEGATLTATFDTDVTTGRTFITEVFYTPPLDFNADNLPFGDGSPRLDEFTFTVEDDGKLELTDGTIIDGMPLSTVATATVRVTPQNDAPIAASDLVSISNSAYRDYFTDQGLLVPQPTEDMSLLVPAAFLLSNDLRGNATSEDETQGIRGNDGPLSIVSASVDPFFGTLQVLATGDLSFVPADDIYGEVAFTYEIEDQGVDEDVVGNRVLNPMRNTVTSTIFLEPVNDAPVAFDRSLSLTEAVEPAGPAVLSFTANDLLIGAGVLTNSPVTTTSTSITVVDGSAMQDGETILFTDVNGQRTVIEFSTGTVASIGTDLLLTYTLAETADDIATNLASLLVNAGLGGVASGPTVSIPVTSAAATSTFTTMISANTVGISIPDPATIVGGESITITDSDGVMTTLELSTNGVPIGTPDALINFTPGVDSAAAIVGLIRAELLGRGIGSIDAGGVGLQSALQFNRTSVISFSEPTSNLSTDADGNLVVVQGLDMVDGELVTLGDGLGGIIVVEFNTTGVPTAGTDIVIEYDFFDSGADLASELETALRVRDLGALAVGDTLVFKSVAAAVARPPVTSIVASAAGVTLPNGAQIIDGETVDLTIDGQPVIVEFNSTGVLSAGSTYVITVAPTDSADDLALTLESTLRADGLPALANGATVDFSSVASISVTELPAVAGDFADDLIAPYNETEQALRVVTFTTSAGTIDVDDVGNDTATLMTDTGGELSLTFSGGLFVSGTYTPPVDYNQLPPFQPADLFTYGIADNGRTTLPFSNLVRNLADERSVEMATVTITVEPANDAPVFDTPVSVEILEDDFGTTVPDVVTNVMPAAATAQDELATQNVSFTVVDALSTVPAGLMTQSPIVTPTGGLTVFPAPDAVGSAIYVIRGTDDHPTNPQSTDATVTVHVRPVNDAPRFDDAVAGTADFADADEAYSVARVIDPNTGEIIDATITYTLREDNTQALGATEPYFIPLERDPAVVGYNQVGLLDVFTVGPPNEADGTLGGDQSLNLFDFPATTLLGGSLTEVRDTNDVLIGLNYVPPLNFNEVIGGTDTFLYTVQDGSVAGETYDLATGMLISDPQTATNAVQFRLNPVNDKPEFDLNLLREDQGDPTSPFLPIETPEDSATTVIDNFAFNINAGPPATAFDEVDVINGQTVRFSVTSLGFPAEQAADFFSEFPTISPEGQLRFQPAPDVFGSFDFEIVLTDDGPGNATRGDLISSDPVTVTIDVLPINDPPVVIPGIDLAFTLNEDQTIDIPVNGDVDVSGLLDAFTAGPFNESTDLTPGGNQTVSIQEPTPVSTASGGTLERVLDANDVLIALRYIPRPNFVGMDSFIYTVTDDGVTVDVDTNGTVRNDPRIASNTVSLNVLGLNDAPQFSGANNVTVDEDSGPTQILNWATNVLPGPITAVDELDSQTINFQIIQTEGPSELFASAPVAVINTDDDSATLQFEPAGDANGLATFTVQLFDDGPDDATAGHDNSSDIRTFTIRVNAINDPPTFTPAGEVTVNEDSGPYAEVWATDVSPGPSDESDQSVRFEVSTPAASQDLFQSLPEISDDGTLRFIPAVNANGTVDLTVTAIDSGGAASTPITLRVIINAVNDQPTAVADELDTDEDALLVIPSSQLLANDIDPDLGNPGDMLTLVRPELGLSLSGATVTYDVTTGDITYDPSTSLSLQALAPGESAVDSFSYSLIDSQGATSNVVTVALNVSGLNDAPIATPDTPTLNPDGPTIIPVLENDTDVDGTINPATIEITLQPAFGSLAIDNTTGVITFTAFQAFSEEDQFRYTVEDNLGAVSESVLVTIAANAAPIARNDQDATFLDESVDINVVANDNDPDAAPNDPTNGLDVTSILIVNPPTSGAAVPLNDGTVRYIPNDGFVGVDSFEYTIADTEGRRSLAAEVQVQVVASRLQNPNLNADVNNDGNVSPIDALLVINRLARAGVSSIPVEPTDVGPPFFDVNGDRRITPADALAVINELARRASGGEGEQIVADETVVDAPLLDLLSDRDEDEDDRLGAIDEAFGDLI